MCVYYNNIKTIMVQSYDCDTKQNVYLDKKDIDIHAWWFFKALHPILETPR